MEKYRISVVDSNHTDYQMESRASTKALSPSALENVYNFHKSFKTYHATPLHSLKALSEDLGVKAVLVKDESYRFGLNAFKVLGGSYAIAQYIVTTLGLKEEDMTFDLITSDEIAKRLGDVTFVTATDGNHGRGIAWAANQLGQKSVVFMPKGSSEIRLQNIRNEGAMAEILDVNYDDAVRFAKQYADENKGVFIQDTAWEGYEEIPTWIMQGYSTLAQEAVEQMKLMSIDKPTHVFLQAGVGSFASSVLGYMVSLYGQSHPSFTILEPDQAACIYESAKAGDGLPHAVHGDLQTIMAGLACGEPSTISWVLLRDYADLYASCSDEVSELGMRILGNPLLGDPSIISGESGAIGMGFLKLIMHSDQYRAVRDKLHLNENSIILLINTEGDTDPENYRKIVWGDIV